MESGQARRLHLIANSKSGQGMAGSLQDLAAKTTQELGFELIHHDIKDPQDLNEKAIEAVKAAEQDGGIVAAAGGDGTVRSVAQHLIGKSVPFAVIPCGTFNLFARNHGIPEDSEGALRLAMQGKPVAVRIAKMNDEIFVLNASLGLYAKVIEERSAWSDRWGRHRIVALISTFFTMMRGHRLLDVDLVYQGQITRTRTSMIFIGNNSLQLKTLALKISDCMKRDLLAVVMMKSMNRWKMFRVLLRGLARTLEHEESLETFCVDSLTIFTRKRTHQVALDGELFELEAPLKIQALPSAIVLIKS